MSAPDLGSLGAFDVERSERAQLEELIDPAIRTALEESGTTAQLLSGEGLYNVLSAFLTELFQEALAVALTSSPQRGGYDELQKPLFRFHARRAQRR